MDVPLVEFTYLVFTRMPGESYCRWLRSLLVSLCYVFQALINSLVCRFFNKQKWWDRKSQRTRQKNERGVKTGKGNQMTALRFQTGGRHPTSPGLPWGQPATMLRWQFWTTMRPGWYIQMQVIATTVMGPAHLGLPVFSLSPPPPPPPATPPEVPEIRCPPSWRPRNKVYIKKIKILNRRTQLQTVSWMGIFSRKKKDMRIYTQK